MAQTYNTCLVFGRSSGLYDFKSYKCVQTKKKESCPQTKLQYNVKRITKVLDQIY